MKTSTAKLFSRARVLVFLFLWAASALVLFALHLPWGFYHGEAWYDYSYCVISIWPAPGIACACLVFVQWLWATDLSSLRKTCLTVLAIVVSIPAVMTLGFFWLLMHLAP